jgi:anti-anti-sigma factor
MPGGSAGSVMVRTVEDLRTVDHACAIPVSDEQLWEMTSTFIAAGLAAGEQVVYFDDGTADCVLERLADDCVPIAESLHDGSLIMVPPDTTRATLRSPPPYVQDLICGTVDDAVERGYTGVRLTGQLSYALQRAGGVSLLQYDDAFDEVIRVRPARLLCLYDRRRFPERAIEELRARHHTELVVPAIYDDNLLRITSTGPGCARLAGEVDHSNRPRIRRLLETALDDALRSHAGPTDITLDLSSLRFLDVAAAVSLVHAAEEFPSSHRLVLTGVRPRVVRVLDRCGAPFAAQLVVKTRPDHTLPEAR